MIACSAVRCATWMVAIAALSVVAPEAAKLSQAPR